eukprot:441805_1
MRSKEREAQHESQIIILLIIGFIISYCIHAPIIPPPLIMYIAASFMLYEQDSLKGKTQLIQNYLMPYNGLISASVCFIIWSIINIFCMSFANKNEVIQLLIKDNDNNQIHTNNKTGIKKIPFMEISMIYCKIFCPFQLKYISDCENFYIVYCCYVMCGLCYLWIVGGVSICLFKYPWINFFFIIILFVWGSIQGFRLFLANLDQEIKGKARKKKS